MERKSTQLINIGLIIITRSTIFSSNIGKWNSKPEADKTWPTFKAHFKEAQRDIKQSQLTITTDSLGFHGQANAAAIIDQVIERLTTHHNPTTTTSAETIAEQQMQQHFSEMANASQQQSMMEQMQSLMPTISTLQTQTTTAKHTDAAMEEEANEVDVRDVEAAATNANADVDAVVNN